MDGAPQYTNASVVVVTASVIGVVVGVELVVVVGMQVPQRIGQSIRKA